MSKLFIDANVVLEILLQRKNAAAAAHLFATETRTFVISPLTVHLCYHLGRKEAVPSEQIAELLRELEILPMDNMAVRLAQRRYLGQDFEDCLQAATAEAGDCEAIVTFDKRFARHSATVLPVKVL